MELYEIKEKVGSDPCLVLDFEFDATLNTSTGMAIFRSKLKTFSTKAEAQTYISDFVKTIEELIKTRCVEFLFTAHTDDVALALFDNASFVSSTIFFGDDPNPNVERTMNIITPAALSLTNIKTIIFNTGTITNSDDTYSAEIVGYLQFT